MRADATDNLRQVSIPVLALFGDKDAHVDVYETMDIYRQELGTDPNDVTIRLFANANHSLIRAETMKPLTMTTWFMSVFLGEDALGDGVAETIINWLEKMESRENPQCCDPN